MNLIKWIRKNERKVMAVVVIILLGGFVFQAFLSQYRRQRTIPRKTIAHFAGGRKITSHDLALARQELDTLKLLRADSILRGIIVPIFQTRDLQAIMLAGLIFTDRTASQASIKDVKQMITANPYWVNEKQINDIYRHSMPSEIYWILLKKEAQFAGIKISEETARLQLEQTIPQLFNNATYPQVISSIVATESVSEEEIINTFGNLIAILKYADLICTNEDITSSQIKHEVSWEEQTIDIEFVKFNSAVFAKTSKEPNEKEIAEHFEQYKSFFSGEISEQNPYSFGYKLHDRIRLEYIAVRLDDVAKIVTEPTQEDLEEFYQRHIEEFTVAVPTDPNDPNSPTTERVRSYGEVAGIISQTLLKNKINSKAESILQEARTLTELGLQDLDIDPEQITPEQYRKAAGDYTIVADQLSTKYKINVYTGRTVPLNALDFITDKYLGTLFIKGYGNNPIALIKVVFAANDLNASELGPFDAPKPRLYENIGPAQDMLGQTMMIVRVTDTQKASVPESINQTVSGGPLELGGEQKTSSIKDKIIKDLNKLAATDTTKSKAEEFIELAKKNGWENTVNKFNELYINSDKATEQDTNAFRLQDLKNVRRISNESLDTLAMTKQGNPMEWWLVNEAETESVLIDRLYSLVPPDSNTVDTLPLAMEFKPDMSCYCLKNISVKRLNQLQYDSIKAVRAYKEDFIQSQSLALIHFNPENILERMKFRQVKEDKTPEDANTPAEAEDDL